VPMKIIIGEREFVDDTNVSVAEMMQVMKGHKGKTSTACPGVQEWLDAFGDADVVYGTTITSGLSGSYNSAAIAANEYMEKHPDRKVFILDSLSAGPELELIMEKFRELSLAKLPFEDVCEKIKAYLRGGAKRIRGEGRYPNNKVGFGALCVADSIPEKNQESNHNQ